MKILSNIKKSLIIVCLGGAIAFAPMSQADARSHRGDTIVAAAIGGAVAGLVGGVVQSAFNPTSTVVVEQPTIVSQPVYVEPEPVVVAPVIIHRPHRYYRPVRYHRHHYYRYY